MATPADDANPVDDNTPSSGNSSSSQPPPVTTTDSNGSHFSAGWIVLIVLILLIVGGAALYFYLHRRARQQGRPPPNLNPFATSSGSGIPSRNYPARGGVVGWFETQVRNFRNKRSRTEQGYEGTALHDAGAGPGFSGGGRRRTMGFGPLDPDEAWDAQVGAEADVYGGEGARGPYHGDDEYGYSSVGVGEIRAGGTGGAQRGRSAHRDELDDRYDEEMGVGRSRGRDPFGDDAAVSQASLRGVSPRPVQDDRLGPSKEDSPTERRSMFKEDIS